MLSYLRFLFGGLFRLGVVLIAALLLIAVLVSITGGGDADVASVALGAVAVLVAALVALLAAIVVAVGALLLIRVVADRKRRYARYPIVISRNDSSEPNRRIHLFEQIGQMTQDQDYRGMRRMLFGQKHIALEMVSRPTAGDTGRGEMFVVCDPKDVHTLDAEVAAAYVDTRIGYQFERLPRARGRALEWVRASTAMVPCTLPEVFRYARARLAHDPEQPKIPARKIARAVRGKDSGVHVIRLFKQRYWLERLATPENDDLLSETILSAMGQQTAPTMVQITMVPMFPGFERFAAWSFSRREREVDAQHDSPGMNSPMQWRQLEEGMSGVALRYLFCVDIRILSTDAEAAKRVAAVIQSGRGENRLVRRTMRLRRNLYLRRLERATPPLLHVLPRILSSAELAALWALPTQRIKTLELERSGVPRGSATDRILTGTVLDPQSDAIEVPTPLEALHALNGPVRVNDRPLSEA